MKKQLLFTTITLLSSIGFAQSSFNFSPNHDVVLCGPTDVYFVCTSPFIPDNVWWDFGDGGTGTGMKPVHRYTTTGVFTVKMITEKSSVKDSIIKVNFVTLHPKPKASFTVNLPASQKPFERLLIFSGKNKSDTIKNYSWMVNNEVIASTNKLTYNFGANGIYSVLLTVTTNNGCSDEFMDTVEVNDEPENHTRVASVLHDKILTVSMLPDQNILVTRVLTVNQASLKIIDITGKVIQQVTIDKGESAVQLQTSALPPSTYIVELNSGGFITAKRFYKTMM